MLDNADNCFTDGITEAWKKDSDRDTSNPDDDMFGSDRLVEIFRNRRSHSPEEIKNAILAELTGYDRADDVTIVVFKPVKA